MTIDRPGRRTRLAALLLCAALAPAAPAAARPPGPPGGHLARHVEQLGLEPEARTALDAIVAESEARELALRAELQAARERMRALLDAPAVDRAAVMAEADTLDALHARSHRNRLDAILRIHELLTPEQRAALVRLRGEERPWRRGRGPLGACSSDLRALCAAAEGPEALRCLAERWDELSPPCQHAVSEGGRGPDDPPGP